MTVQPNQEQRRFLAEINVIPLVDVVLVLLVIFMVTAPMLHRGMDITLPTSTTNTIKPQERIVLTIDGQDTLFLNKEQISPAQLEERLRQAKASNPEVAVYLRADQGISYGTVIKVMDGVKRSGIERLGMVTAPQQQEELVKEHL